MARKNKPNKKNKKRSTTNSVSKKVNSNQVQNLLHEAIKLHNAGDVQNAIKLYQQIIQIDPQNADALHLLGYAAYQCEQYEQSVDLINHAISLRADQPSYYFNLGNVYLKQRKFLDAANAFKAAIAIKPDYDIAIGNLASAYLRAERYEDALECAVKAAKLNPDSKESAVYYSVAANVFLVFGKYSAAEEAAVKGLQCDSSIAELYKLLGDTFSEQGKYGAANEAFALAIQMDPSNIDTQGNYGFSLLASGNLEKGWEYYKTGYKQGFRTPPDYGFTEWHGEDLTGKTIIVLPEQGLGDEILFASCVPDLVAKAKQVYINCDARLGNIYENSFANSIAVRGRKMEDRDHHKKTLPPIDYQVACGNLPGILRNKIEDFPDTVGYLKADQELAKHWKEKVGALGDGLKVGISWRSGILNVRRAHHYVSLEDWQPILTIPGVNFVNLQYDDCQNILDNVEKKMGVRIHNFQDIDLRDDLDNTLALIDSLDMVISIGNAVYILSSALGKETWKLAMPSWLMLGTDHEPWFPNSRIFVKPEASEWKPVISKIALELKNKTNN